MKHRPTVEPGQQPESPEKRDTIRELGELEAELRRAGSHRQAKTVANAIKLLRARPAPPNPLADKVWSLPKPESE
jgi:hypothetical protein